MEEEDDPVVEEIPVFISNTLIDSLYLLQYPIKNETNNFDTANVVNCCVKPYNEQIKVDFAVSTKSKNYDAFRGDQLAQQADGMNAKQQQQYNRPSGSAPVERPTFPSGRMDKLSYTSSKPAMNVHRYVIGVLNDREVHCTPLKSVLQMRPSFSYFDKKDTRDKVEQKAKSRAAGLPDGDAHGTPNSESDDEDVRQVTVKFQSNERFKKIMEQSYEHHAQRMAEEPWCETMWYTSETGQAELERQKLYSNKAEMIGHTLGLNSEDYIKNLIPPERKEVSIDSFVPSKVVHCSKRKTMSLADQIKHILIDAKLVSFQHLVTQVDKKLHSKEKILQTLSTIGVLLRGNWVIQSEFLYPEKTWSTLNGVPAEFMCRARDYILFQFTKKISLSRQKMAEVTQLPAEELKEIMQSVAELNDTSKEWELTLEPDAQFELHNSDLVQRQELVWRSKEEQFQEMEAEKPSTSTLNKRVRKRSIRESKPEAGTSNKMSVTGNGLL